MSAFMISVVSSTSSTRWANFTPLDKVTVPSLDVSQAGPQPR
jgi:hypothetical protein